MMLRLRMTLGLGGTVVGQEIQRGCLLVLLLFTMVGCDPSRPQLEEKLAAVEEHTLQTQRKIGELAAALERAEQLNRDQKIKLDRKRESVQELEKDFLHVEPLMEETRKRRAVDGANFEKWGKQIRELNEAKRRLTAELEEVRRIKNERF